MLLKLWDGSVTLTAHALLHGVRACVQARAEFLSRAYMPLTLKFPSEWGCLAQVGPEAGLGPAELLQMLVRPLVVWSMVLRLKKLIHHALALSFFGVT